MKGFQGSREEASEAEFRNIFIQKPYSSLLPPLTNTSPFSPQPQIIITVIRLKLHSCTDITGILCVSIKYPHLLPDMNSTYVW